MFFFRARLLVIFLASLRLCSTQIQSNEKSYNFQDFMDTTQNPCNNFYGYACGKWKQTLKETSDVFRDLEEYMKLQYLHLFANGFERRMKKGITERNAVYKKTQDIYESCRKTLTLEMFQYIDVLRSKHSDLSFLEILHNSNGSITENDHDWMKVLGHLRSYGFNNGILSLNVVRLNSTTSLIKFGKPEGIEFDTTEKLVLEPLDPQFKAKILEFKQQLETAGKGKSSEKTDSFSFTEVVEYFPNSNIRTFLEMLPLPHSIEKLQFQMEDIQYIKDLHRILSETPDSVVAFFIGLKFVSYLRTKSPRSSSPFDCMMPIKNHIPEILNFIYAEKFFSGRKRTIDEISKIFGDLKTTFLKTFEEHETHLGTSALRFLQEKILFMDLNIGQLPKGVENDFYENYLKDLEVEAETFNSFYSNHLNLMHFQVSKDLKKLSLSAKDESYIFNLRKSGPAFDVFSNLIFYPFSLLTDPIFNDEDERLFHYAGIGSIMAHDMSHAFDTTNLKHDAHGNPSDVFEGILENNKHFQEALTCIQKGLTSRLDEKIAEFVGSRIGFKAYFENPEEHLFQTPLNMTRKQVFFVKFSQFYCVAEPQTSNDGPFKWLTDIVENNKEFYEAFGCVEPTNHEICNFW